MRIFASLALAASLLTAGCATTSAKKLANISIGMNKTEVIQILGSPESVSASGQHEVFVYTLGNSFTNAEWNSTYNVRFVDGRVVGYGQ